MAKIDREELKRKEFGENLERLVKQKGISRKKLAEVLNVAENSVSAYTLGRRAPSFDRLFLLAEALDVSMAELLGEVPVIPDDVKTKSKVQAAIKILREAGLVPLLLTEDALVILNNPEEAATND